jgi:hypothetical protein
MRHFSGRINEYSGRSFVMKTIDSKTRPEFNTVTDCNRETKIYKIWLSYYGMIGFTPFMIVKF